MHGKLFMQLSWLPSQSRHRSWVNDCICRRQQQLEVTQKQNMLLIPATCNGQICRRRIKYACEAGAKSKESPLDPEQHKVRARDDFHEKQQKKAACYKFCDSIWNTNTNTTGHGRMRKRHLVMDFLPVRWMRLTFCGQPAAPLQTQLEILTLPPHTHTHHSRWYFNFSASLTDERTDRQSDWTDRRTDVPHYFQLSSVVVLLIVLQWFHYATGNIKCDRLFGFKRIFYEMRRTAWHIYFYTVRHTWNSTAA